MSTTQIQTPEVEIDKIHVIDGFNARRQFDEAELKTLAATIETNGIVQPVRVRQRDDGEFDLVAGERRYRAAKLAGLTMIPISISTGNAHAESLIENIHRQDLNPIEVALGLKAVAEEFGLTTHAKIADHQNVDKNWVGAHLRLLDLPAEVQPYIATGDVPVSAEPKLRKIAAVSPEIAALICEVGKRNEVTGPRFVQAFGDLLSQAAQADIKGKPTMIPVRQCWLSDVFKSKKKHREIADRINAVASYEQEDPKVPFDEAEVDAARAAGCLVEYESDRNSYYHPAFVTDRAFAEDLAVRAVERRENEVAARIAAEAEEKARRKEDRASERRRQKESGEETAQAKAKKRKAIARRFNDSLKRALLKKRTVARRKKYALARSKAVLVQLVSDNPRLAGAGLRLVSDQLQEVEVTPLKKGGGREKVVYATEQESTAELLRRGLAATDPLEVIEVASEALLAGILADTDEVPNKDHISWHTPVEKEIRKFLATEIKEVRPRRARKPY